MPALPKIAIIILHWNSVRDTLACLDAVSRLEYERLQVIVVDNGSTDGSAEMIRACHPQATLLSSAENLGYAGGNNFGMRYALDHGADYFWLLNDDVLIAPDSLAVLISAAQANSAVGFLGPLVYLREEPQSILSAGGFIGSDHTAYQRGLGEPDQGQYAGIQEVAFVSGCALMASREMVDRVGILDEDFFAYQEEIEWCYRARQAGFKVLFVSQAKAWHPDTRRRDQFSPVVTYYITRNSLLFARKHRLGNALIARMIFNRFLTLVSWTVQPRWRQKRRQRDAMARGLADYLRGRFGRAEAL